MNCRHLPLALVVSASLLVAGCGEQLKDSGIPDGSGGSKAAALADQTSTAAAAPAAPTEDAAKTYAKGTAVEPIGNAKDLAKKPGIPKPKGDPPKELVVKDLVVGTGPAAKPGDMLTVRYAGSSYSTGKEFDASWKTPENAFPFTLGQQQVIPGWDAGIVGMKAGGRRELVIPPAQGYGEAGSPPNIKGGESLIFVVDLKKIG